MNTKTMKRLTDVTELKSEMWYYFISTEVFTNKPGASFTRVVVQLDDTPAGAYRLVDRAVLEGPECSGGWQVTEETFKSDWVVYEINKNDYPEYTL